MTPSCGCTPMQESSEHVCDGSNLLGEKWNVQLKISPVIPKLIKGVLFDE